MSFFYKKKRHYLFKRETTNKNNAQQNNFKFLHSLAAKEVRSERQGGQKLLYFSNVSSMINCFQVENIKYPKNSLTINIQLDFLFSHSFAILRTTNIDPSIFVLHYGYHHVSVPDVKVFRHGGGVQFKPRDFGFGRAGDVTEEFR